MISEQYSEMMKELLGSRYLEYEDLLNEKPYRGYRINHLKIDDDTFFSLYGLSHQKIPFIPCLIRHCLHLTHTQFVGCCRTAILLITYIDEIICHTCSID